MYIEWSCSNSASDHVFCGFERTDIIKITKISYFYDRFPFVTNISLKPMGRFKNQLILEDNTWNTRYILPKLILIVIHQLNGH